MKRLLLLFLPVILLLAGRAEAQFQKGTVHWGATISSEGTISRFESFQSIETKNNSHMISPSVQFGKFVRDNTMFGLRITPSFNLLNSEVTAQNTNNKFKNNSLTVNLSPFVRRYKFLSEKWAIFIQPGLNLAYLRSKASSQDEELTNGYGGGIYVVPGIIYQITPRFALESDLNLLSLNLNYYHMDDWDHFHFNAGATSGIQSYFGLRASWYLTKSN
ncbi:hypothetical protein [Dyadobacter sp. 676]|uniref:Outer membrane protein beta-barrel domain-containing protein n=1 Tax=Dyadobacter sp. 676 TaxID=3088362 RepID=A0AAU8FNV5_9BACT